MTTSSLLPSFFTGIFFSDIQDLEPTTVRVTSNAGTAECAVLFPGIGPWHRETPDVACARTFSDPDISFWVDIAYPEGEFPARQGQPIPPSPAPRPTATCNSEACSAPSAAALPLPDFPHVRLGVTAGNGVLAPLLTVFGNGRSFELLLPLHSVADSVGYTYVNIDSPPAQL